jgi:hypothetical protein
MVTITEADVGTELSTNGVIDSIVMTAPPNQHVSDYFSLTDGDRALFHMHISTSPVSSGSNLLSGGTISFESLVLKSIPPGCVFEIEFAMPPVLSVLIPNSAEAGSPEEIVLSCSGSGFTRGTIIVFGDHDEPTDFVKNPEGEITITTIVKPKLFVNPDIVPVKVRTGSLVSDPLDFTFTEPVARE